MKFAFLMHPLSEASKRLVRMSDGGGLHSNWGGVDLLHFCNTLSRSIAAARDAPHEGEVRVIDELSGLRSQTGACTQGRVYEIPLEVDEIIADPARAIGYMEQAVEQAVQWGAQIVGLGSMTGIVGGQGTYLAKSGKAKITTGNCLTVFTALENLNVACREAEIDPRQETVAVVGIPGSIATVTARLLADRVDRLLLVARRSTPRAEQLADELNAELLLDIPSALARARVVVSATSSGGCIRQRDVRSGAVVIDIGVPADVVGGSSVRDDVLFITGGLSLTPQTMRRDSVLLSFHHGMVPSCLGETMSLALENRAECFSLGRDLCPQRVNEIGALATKHGFDFSRLMSFGVPVSETQLARCRKSTHRRLRAAGRDGIVDRKREASPRRAAVASDDNGSRRRGVTTQFSREQNARAAQLFGRYVNPVLHALGRESGFVKTFVRGEGNYLFDADGRKYLDFVAGFGSVNFGHNHPSVVQAVQTALVNRAPGFVPAAINPAAALLAENLVTIAPEGLEMVFFANSGAEAVEAAVKLARKATGRSQLLSCQGSFHGKTLGALSVTGNADYQRPFGPLLPGCRTVPYGDLAALEPALATRQCAALLIEPIQGEGGMNVPPEGYLAAAQRLCRQSGTLLMIDEVQTGLGRTGDLFACDRDQIAPDVMTLAKSLGGGMVPIGAMLTRRDLWRTAYGTIDTFALHTSTFGGGSLACSAALSAIDLLLEGDLLENTRLRGLQLQSGLNNIIARCAYAQQVRGRGLMLGLEIRELPPSVADHFKQADESGMMQFMVPGLDRLIGTLPTLYVMQTLLQHGIYTQPLRSSQRVLRIQPPLTITEEEVDLFLAALEQVCAEFEESTETVRQMISKSIAGFHGGNGRSDSPGGLYDVNTSQK